MTDPTPRVPTADIRNTADFWIVGELQRIDRRLFGRARDGRETVTDWAVAICELMRAVPVDGLHYVATREEIRDWILAVLDGPEVDRRIAIADAGALARDEEHAERIASALDLKEDTK